MLYGDEVPFRLTAGAAEARVLSRHEDILDSKQEYLQGLRDGPGRRPRARRDAAAFRALPEGAINREDRLRVPAAALREIVEVLGQLRRPRGLRMRRLGLRLRRLSAI